MKSLRRGIRRKRTFRIQLTFCGVGGDETAVGSGPRWVRDTRGDDTKPRGRIQTPGSRDWKPI